MHVSKQYINLPIIRHHLASLLLVGKEEERMAECLSYFMTELEKTTSAGELQLTVFDEAEPFRHFTPVPGRHRAINSSPAAAIHELEWANWEMAMRYELFAQTGCRDFFDYNRNHGDSAMPRLVIVIQELGELMAADGRKTEQLLVNLLARSDAAGIYVICSTTCVRPDVLSARLLGSFGHRLVFRTNSKEESELLGLKTIPLLKKWRKYRGNSATLMGKEIEEREKLMNASKLDVWEAVFFFYRRYMTYENGWRSRREKRRSLVKLQKNWI